MQCESTNRKPAARKPRIAEGKWTRAEQDRFLRGMQLYGRNWSMVQKKVKTRTLTQVRSHAQKVFQNMSKEDIDSLIGPIKDEEGSSETFTPSERDIFSKKSTRGPKKNQELKLQDETSLQFSGKQVIQTGESFCAFKPFHKQFLPEVENYSEKKSGFMDIYISQIGYFSNGGSFLDLTGLFNSKLTFQIQNSTTSA